jgi:putative peptide zinc metalloprotease protein
VFPSYTQELPGLIEQPTCLCLSLRARPFKSAIPESFVKSLPKLRGDLEFVRQRGSDGEPVYIVVHPVSRSQFEFGEMEFFLLNRLDGETDFARLAEDLFSAHGVTLEKTDFDAFVHGLEEAGFLEGRAGSGIGEIEDLEALFEPDLADLELDGLEGDPLPVGSPAATDDAPELWAQGPQGRSAGLGRGTARHGRSLFKQPVRYWRLKDMDGAFASIARVLRPLRGVRLLVPLLVLAALAALVQNWPLARLDISRIWSQWNLLAHLVFSLLTVNLAVKFFTGVAASALGARAPGFGIALVAGLVPRFHVEIEGDETLPRAERLWLYATPLFVSLGLFSLGVLGWFMARPTGTQLAFFFFTLAMVATFSMVISANPLGRGYGYALVSTWYGVPEFRGRAFRAFLQPILPPSMRLQEGEVHNRFALRAYALAAILYLLALFAAFFYLAATWLETRFAGAGVIIFFVIVVLVFANWVSQTSRWREILRDGGMAGRRKAAPRKEQRPGSGWGFLVGLLAVLAGSWFIPYPYETGGPMEVRPVRSQEVYAELRGMIESVDVRPGTWVEAGTTLARLADYRQVQDVAATRAMIARQEAMLAKLLMTPREAELRLAERQNEAALVEERFAREQYARQRRLLREGHSTQEEHDLAKRRAEIATEGVLQQAANLDLVREGPHPADVEAARAELQRLKEELILAEELLARTRLVSRIAGRVTDLELKNKVGIYLDDGDLFAEILDDSVVRVFISIPEVDLDRLQIGTRVRMKFWAYPHRIFPGSVVEVEPRVIEDVFGRVARVVVEVPNADRALVPGMTGHGKALIGTEPMLVAFTHPVMRFLQVELWSWIP